MCVWGVHTKVHNFHNLLCSQLYGIFILVHTCEEDGTVVKDILFIFLQSVVAR